MSNPSENTTASSVKKQTRRFAPTIRGRGRGDRGLPSSRSETNDNTPNTEQPLSDTTASTSDTKSSGQLGTIRSEASEGRLQSVHGQKTRGGTTKMKFKPTIPTKRNKKEVPTEDTSKEKEGRDGFRSSRGRGDFRGRGRGGGRGRGRGRGLIVEEVTASGIFSLGPSAISSRARNGYAASSGSFATYGGDASSRFETENGSESDINVLFANATDGYTPTVFDHVGRLAGSLDPVDLSAPKKKIPWLTTKSVDEKDEKKEDNDDEKDNIKNVKDEENTKDILIDKVKKEKMDDDDEEEINEMDMDMDKKEKNQVDEETTQQNQETWMMYEDSPAQNIFAVNEKNKVVSVADDELLFFQLPSVVPTFESHNTDNDEEMKDAKTEEEEDNSNNNKGKQKVDDDKGKSKLPPSAQRATLEEQMKSMDLEDMPDGQIGKIVIYKSGKMKLKIGNVLLDIEQGMRSSFLENVMVVDTSNETSKKAVELGHIVQKFTCAPNMDALLEGCEENYD
ncbi:unnamed protein product [Cunninghamella echinulata]